MKTDKDWREIDRRMSQTLEIRRKMIDCRAPLKDILTMFPFLKCPYQVSYSHKTASGLGVTFASRSFSSSFLWSGDQTAWQGSGCGSQYGVSRTVKAVRASGSPFERTSLEIFSFPCRAQCGVRGGPGVCMRLNSKTVETVQNSSHVTFFYVFYTNKSFCKVS